MLFLYAYTCPYKCKIQRHAKKQFIFPLHCTKKPRVSARLSSFLLINLNSYSLKMLCPFALNQFPICNQPSHDRIQIFQRYIAFVMSYTNHTVHPYLCCICMWNTFTNMDMNWLSILLGPKEDNVFSKSTNFRQLRTHPFLRVPK